MHPLYHLIQGPSRKQDGDALYDALATKEVSMVDNRRDADKEKICFDAKAHPVTWKDTESFSSLEELLQDPFDYLMKPCEAGELDSVLTEALRVIGAGDPEITIATARDRFNVPLRSVCAAVSRGHNVDLILTNNQSLTSTETFKSISDKLSADPRFLLINRGVLINMDQVLSPIEGAMKMKDGKVYPVKVNGRAAVLSAFSQYMISRVDRRGI